MTEQIFLTVNDWMTSSLAIAALGCFLWGVISVMFSPCHLASIPLIVSYVAGQNRTVSTGTAAKYAVVFTGGLFITIAAIGTVCSLLGRMLDQTGSWWTILVGIILIWVGLDMIGIETFSISGAAMNRLKVRGLPGAFILGLAYGLLSGSCTLGFIAPVLAFITIQKQVVTGILYIVLFGVGHCLPIAIAGSSAAFVKKLLENSRFQSGSTWFRRAAGVVILLLAISFIARPFFS